MDSCCGRIYCGHSIDFPYYTTPFVENWKQPGLLPILILGICFIFLIINSFKKNKENQVKVESLNDEIGRLKKILANDSTGSLLIIND